MPQTLAGWTSPARQLCVVTFPTCPICSEALRPEHVRGNHGRPAVRFMVCRCGHQEGHRIGRVAVPA